MALSLLPSNWIFNGNEDFPSTLRIMQLNRIRGRLPNHLRAVHIFGLTMKLLRITLTLCVLIPIAANADEAAFKSSRPSVEELAKRVRRSLVVIESTGRQGKRRGEGSGFAVADDLIVTARHVIGDGRPVMVALPDEQTVEVTHIYSQMSHLDLAVLKTAPHGLPVLELSENTELSIGQDAIAMGHPYGLRNSIVKGVISGRRDIDGISMLQLAMSIEPGNSGGPVVDRQGRVLGIVTLKSTESDNIGFAVPVRHLRQLLDSPNPVPMNRWVRIGALDKRRWETVGGAQWKQRAGRMTVEGTGEGFGGRTLCLMKETPEFPIEIEVDVRLEDEQGAAGLAIHSDGDQKHYGFYPSAGNLRFTRFDGPDVNHWTILHNEPHAAYRPGDWNTLKVRIESDKMECSVNGRHVLTTDDMAIAPGQLGYASFRGTQAAFRNLIVAESISGKRMSVRRRAEINNILARAFAGATTSAKTVAQLESFGAETPRVLRSRAAELEAQADRIRQLADDVHTSQVRTQLLTTLRRSGDFAKGGEEPDLLKAALLLAQLDNDEVRPHDYIRRVESMVSEIQSGLADDASESDSLGALDRWLFEENGFRGSSQQYYTRSNSYLNEVIDDREGLPVTLSVLYIEMARRLNVRVAGIGLPGHFIVQFDPSDETEPPQWIDVFNRGIRLTEDEVDQQIHARGSTQTELFKAAQSNEQIVERMLRNLLGLAEQARPEIPGSAR